MDSFSADAKPLADVDLGDVRTKIHALEEAHRANGIPLSGRVIHVCHYLPVTATLASHATSSLPSPPGTPTSRTPNVSQSGPRWKLAPRIGHSAMVSGIRSISATHEQVIVGWTGDLYAPTPAPAASPVPPTIMPGGGEEQKPSAPSPDYSAQTTGVLPPPTILHSESVSEEDRKALTEQVYASEDVPMEGSEGGAYAHGENEDKAEGAKPIRLVPVWLDDKVAHGHYEGYCKTTLWPLFHYLLWQDVATEYASADAYWSDYQAANAAFARAVLEVYQPGDLIWVHDYHLLLVPRLIRELELERAGGPPAREEGGEQPSTAIAADGACIGLFVHTPFPSSEIFRCLPRRKEILDGMLGANLVCFQTYSYSRHFTSSCIRVCGYEISPGRGIDVQGHVTTITHTPVGVDAGRVAKDITRPGLKPKLNALRALYEGKKIIVGRDKLDVVKGVLQKLRAFEKLLHDYPEWIGNVVLIQVTSPTAMSPDTAKLERQVSEAVARINGEYGSLDFIPVHHYHQTITKDEFYALLSVADLAVVTPFRDGMNTTSMDYVIAQEKTNKSPLILSEFMGITNNMGEAMNVNPWNLGDVAAAMNRGLTMPQAEKERRHASLYKTVTTHTSHVWAAVLVQQLLGIVGAVGLAKQTPVLPQDSISAHYAASKKRLFLFDYDGTLAPIVKVPSMATPSEPTLEALTRLTADPKNVVYIISGRDGEFLETHLGHLKGLGMSAEHGGFVREPGETEWTNFTETLDMDWMNEVHDIFKYYTERTTGSHIELKKSSITWHYRSSDPEWGLFQCRQCQDLLENNVANKRPIDILVGKKNLEVRPSAVNKGEIVKRILYYNSDAEFVFCAGDDKTDEDMFRALQFPQGETPLRMPPPIAVKLSQKDAPTVELALTHKGIFSTAVGHSSKRTLAAWHVTTPAEVVDSMLQLLNAADETAKL